MSTSRWTTVHCDGVLGDGFGCGATVDGKRAADARKQARAQGWKRMDGRDVCAICQYEEQKEAERRAASEDPS